LDGVGRLGDFSHDALGSIIAIYDASGSYVNVYMYDEFGNFLRKTESVVNSYYYTGQEFDKWSGLYNLRNRYYNASLGRFTQLDPIIDLLGLENMQELNGYTYVANNPMVLVDPFGLCGLPVWVSHFFEAYSEMQKERIIKFFTLEGGYADLNISFLYVFTGGIIYEDGNFYGYLGFSASFGYPVNVTLTRSTEDVSFAWNAAFGVSLIGAYQQGVNSYSMQPFTEGGVGLPAASLMAFYVFKKPLPLQKYVEKVNKWITK